MANLRMPEINNVVLVGNLTRDPVFRQMPSGNELLSFTVAANRRYRDSANQSREEVCFVGVVARNKLAESCKNRLKKSDPVLIEGELQSRNWKDDDGHSYWYVEIKARRIQFLSKQSVQPQDGKGTLIQEGEQDGTAESGKSDGNEEKAGWTKDAEETADIAVMSEDDLKEKNLSSGGSNLFQSDSSDP